jgi:hypothetical protein
MISCLVGLRGRLGHHKGWLILLFAQRNCTFMNSASVHFWWVSREGLWCTSMIRELFYSIQEYISWLMSDEQDFPLYCLVQHVLHIGLLEKAELYAGQLRWAQWGLELEGWSNTAALLAGSDPERCDFALDGQSMSPALTDNTMHLPSVWGWSISKCTQNTVMS